MKGVRFGCVMLAVGIWFLVPAVAAGQDHGEGSGGGCGDVFGDLVHILRDMDTGQPILAMRWIEMPAEVPGYGWGYCPIPVDEFGSELGFADLSCDIAESDADLVVEVDYFGRLNGGRTKPRNQRMHFNEVIETIKDACEVKQEQTGRLKFVFCDELGNKIETAIVDSPMENMGLYVRLMKYGHLQTDPAEPDYWAKGDPATGPQLQPALGPEDWYKFHKSVLHLLPGWYKNRQVDENWIAECFSDDDGDGVYEVEEPYTDENGNGLYDPPDPTTGYLGEPFTDLDGDGERDMVTEIFYDSCAPDATYAGEREELSNEDFVRAGSFLAGAANKTGIITRDLVQYFNRIGKILTTEAQTLSPPKTLPALVRVCEVSDGVLDPESEEQSEPIYGDCDTFPANGPIPDPAGGGDFSLPPNADLFTDVLERFVDFGEVEYVQMDWRNETVEGVFPSSYAAGTWVELSIPFGTVVPLMGWLSYANPDTPSDEGVSFIDGFVAAASDGVRSIEFVHNYALPVDLWPDYFTVAPEHPEAP